LLLQATLYLAHDGNVYLCLLALFLTLDYNALWQSKLKSVFTPLRSQDLHDFLFHLFLDYLF